MWVDSGGKCVMQQVFKPSENFDFRNSEKFDYDSCLELLRRLVNMGNIKRICDGFDKDKIEVSKPVDVCSYPYHHARSQKCQVFIDYDRKKCIECTQLAQKQQRITNRATKRKLELTPVTRSKRARITSKCRLDYLTPNSKKKRLREASHARWRLNTKVNKLEQLLASHDVNIEHEESNSLEEIVNIINDKFSGDVREVIQSASEDPNQKELIQRVWKRDSKKRKQQDLKDFKEDQMKNSRGCKSNRWSAITYRIALAVYSRSPAAYQALSKFDILHLPSVWSVQQKLRDYVDEPG